MSKKKITIYDETLRDGVQSLWALKMTYGMTDAVAQEQDQGGFRAISFAVHAGYLQMAVRWGEDPWEVMRLLKRKIKNSKLSTIWGPSQINIDKPYEPPAIWKLLAEKLVEASGLRCATFMSNSIDEVDRFPGWFAFLSGLGVESYPAINYYPSPRTTDEYFTNLTRKVMGFKPDRIYLKDAGGLLTVERLKTLLPIIMKEAKGIPVGIHTHGMSTNSGRVLVEAMKMGVDEVHTCVPPLANGSSHTSVFDLVHNAKLLGIETNINEKPLRVVEERLTAIAKQENLLIGAPLAYDHGVYIHQIPGGVMGTLKNQLSQMGLINKLDEVLEEVPRVIKDLGYPIMITPHSQFVVTQATVNVATGERYKEIIDNLVELALGVYGWEDSGARYMDPNLKDKILSSPNVKSISEKWAKNKAEADANYPVKYYKEKYNMLNASDEDFLLYYIMHGDAEIKKMRALGGPENYKKYFTDK